MFSGQICTSLVSSFGNITKNLSCYEDSFSVALCLGDHTTNESKKATKWIMANFFETSHDGWKAACQGQRTRKRRKKDVATVKAIPMRSFLHTASCNETTTILDYPWEEIAPDDPYARNVRPGDVTVTSPSGWEREVFFDVGPRPIGKRARGSERRAGRRSTGAECPRERERKTACE